MTERMIQPATTLNRNSVMFGLRKIDMALGGCVVGVIVAVSGGDYVFLALITSLAFLSALTFIRNSNRDRFLRDTACFFVSGRVVYDCMAKTARTLAH